MKTVHPSKFFEMVDIEIGMDVVQHFDNDLKEELKKIHPENLIVPNQIKIPIYRVEMEYDTINNHRTSTKYIILPPADDEGLAEYSDFWIDMACNDYNLKHNDRMKNIKIISERHVCSAVLLIG